ncbi:MAG: transposase [Aureispira sp.]|nr:transposase [Aureispira sp.]
MGDRAYRGNFAQQVEKMQIAFDLPQRAKGQKGFDKEKKRWIVERTISWFYFFRRIVIDYEHTTSSSQAFLLLANISMACRRIDFSKI